MEDAQRPELDEETLAFAHRMFELARSGGARELADTIDQGLPPNLTNDKGDTLLILASYHDQPDVVRVLLEKGADTARVNDRGQTAIGSAVFRRSVACVSALLEAGADPNLGTQSAFEVARFFDLPEMTALLSSNA